MLSRPTFSYKKKKLLKLNFNKAFLLLLNRLFSSRRCARCGAGLSSSELVMRAKELVFHVSCFSCAICGKPLSTGDTAGISGGRIFCGEHYEADILRYIQN